MFVHFIRVRLVIHMRFAIFRTSLSEYYRRLLEFNQINFFPQFFCGLQIGFFKIKISQVV